MKKLLHSMFTNNWICVVLMVCEIGGIIPFFKMLADHSYALWIVSYIVGYLTFIYILNKDEELSNKLPWICVVLIIPPFGALFYGLFHRNNLSRKDRKHLELVREKTQHRNEKSEIWMELEHKDKEAAGKAKTILHDDREAAVYTNTDARYYPLGEQMFADMMEDLKKAEHFIFLEYFLVSEGIMWNAMLEVLKEKADKGVEVRMLYDDVCSFAYLPADYDKKMRSFGIECYRFSKFTPIASTVHNNRDHRKILSIDGVVGYTGGINLADEYINQKVMYGHWKDGGIRLEGDAVEGLTKLFLTNWDMNQKTISAYDKYTHIEQEQKTGKGFYIPYGSGPVPAYNEPVGKHVYMGLINQAKDYIYITTPYLIIDNELTGALKNAAIRGVKVVIITPHIPDKKLIFLMTRSNYPSLMKAGVHIYEYESGFVHAKTVVTDDKYGVSGTINFDYRSLVHHYEDAVLMYDSEVIPDMKKDLEDTIQRSIEMTSENTKMNLVQQALKSVVQLVAPLL